MKNEEKYNFELEKLIQKLELIQTKSLDEQLQVLKSLGFEFKNLNISDLIQSNSNLHECASQLNNLYKSKNFKDFKNFNGSLNKKDLKTKEDELKLKELGIRSTLKEIEDKQSFCFIGDNRCSQLINAHSIQENGELSKISENKKVLQFIQNHDSANKDLKEVEISKASTFKGFCHYHDQIFENIDKDRCSFKEEEYFLYSLRSFSYSYFNVKAFNNHFDGLIESNSKNLNSTINVLHDLISSIGFNLPINLEDFKISNITNDQKNTLDILRFQKYKESIVNIVKNKTFNQLEYLVYETSHLCPIACSSWLKMHAILNGNYIVKHDEENPYYAIPIIISVIPSEEGTKIILARFRNDEIYSETIFNNFRNLLVKPRDFELEISKLIIEQVENFYLTPSFTHMLNDSELKILKTAINIEKKTFPDKRTNFEMINFFDGKFKINKI